MKKYRVTVSWTVPEEDTFEVEAENEAEAKSKAVDDNDEIGEDYSVDRVVCLGDVDTKPEPEPEDPNQMKFEL